MAAQAEPGHEARDVPARAVALWLALGAVVVVGSVVWILLAVAPPGDTVVTPPDRPTLQVSPRADLAELQARVHQRLTSYGWVDREQGLIHIPIERAMALRLERQTRGGESP